MRMRKATSALVGLLLAGVAATLRMRRRFVSGSGTSMP